ncbi:hypothetical protein BXU08_00320 [Sphingomonas sp. LM7]|nr:hypothetical protein BXU08_00320 [Sphingomonas sp. LM7]
MFRASALPFAIANSTAAVAAIGSVILFTRLLSPSNYGVYASAFAAVLLLQNLAFFWLQSAALRLHGKVDSDDRHFSAAMRASFLISAIFASLVWVGVAAWLFAASSVAVVLLGWMLLVLRGWLSLVNAWNRSHGHVWRYVATELASSAGALLFGAGAIWMLPNDASAPLLGAVAAVVLATLLTPELLFGPVRMHTSSAQMRAFWHYGAPLALVSLATTLLALSDRLLLAGLLGPVAVGGYSVGYALAERPLNLVLQPIGLASKPALFKAFETGGIAAARPILERDANWLMLLGFPAAATLIAVPHRIATILVGTDMAAMAAEVMPWVALGTLFSCLAVLHFALAFQLSKNTAWAIAAIAPAAAANIVANLLLIPRYGFVAAAWSTAACYALVLVLMILIGRRHVHVPLPVGALLRATASSLALFAFLTSSGWEGVSGLVQMVVGGAVVYCTALALTTAMGSRLPRAAAD